MRQKRPNSGDQKCIRNRRKSFIAHPSASSFKGNLCERVFQQPQAIAQVTSKRYARFGNLRYSDFTPATPVVIWTGRDGVPDAALFHSQPRCRHFATYSSLSSAGPNCSTVSPLRDERPCFARYSPGRVLGRTVPSEMSQSSSMRKKSPSL